VYRAVASDLAPNSKAKTTLFSASPQIAKLLQVEPDKVGCFTRDDFALGADIIVTRPQIRHDSIICVRIESLDKHMILVKRYPGIASPHD
jgi:hypothetical protein